MINQLFTALKYSGTITLTLFTIRAAQANATEYVFSAPPEIDNNVVQEIPAQEVDYPLYECASETSEIDAEEPENEESIAKIDSHNCECIDCEETFPEVEEQGKLSSRQHQKQ